MKIFIKLFIVFYLMIFFSGAVFETVMADVDRKNCIGCVFPEDLPYLPDICKYTWDGLYRDVYEQGFVYSKGRAETLLKNEPKYQKLYTYYKKFGSDLQHMHHFCRGLKRLREAQTASVEGGQRDFYYSQAIGEMEYVLKNSTPHFNLRPNIMLKQSEIYHMWGKYQEAVSKSYAIIKGWKKFVPAYLYLSYLLEEKGNKTESKKILKLGLTYSPDSVELKTRLQNI